MPKITSPSSHSFAFDRQSNLRSCCGVFLALAWLAVSAAQAQITNYVLGTPALLVGPVAGSNSVVLGVTPATGAWTASANTNWLHLDPANQSGIGSTNVVFSYDANPGATRSGTLAIGDQTLTVTQAGSTYVAAGAVTTLVSFVGSDLSSVSGIAVDGAGDVYYIALLGTVIEKWARTSDTVAWLISPGPTGGGIAVDSAGNVYFATTGIVKWTAANNNVNTLVSSVGPSGGVAVDRAGNVYFTSGNFLKEWTVANSNVTTLVSSGLSGPQGVAVDAAGNVYIADTGNNAIKEWTVANGSVTTWVSSNSSTPLYYPTAVAVDGAGDVYIADTGDGAIKRWTAANNNVNTVSLRLPSGGVAVDGVGDVFIGIIIGAIVELPHVFVDPTPKLEGLAADSDALPVVLPPTENLLPPFTPTSDQTWLTITGITNGVVSFSFTANTGSARTAHITLLGQTIPITQGLIGTPPNLTGARMLRNGVLQFAFTNTPGASFTVVSTTNLSLPFANWTVVGAASNTAPGQFQFTSQPTTNDPQRFYGVRSP
jgi:hypothetical protein